MLKIREYLWSFIVIAIMFVAFLWAFDRALTDREDRFQTMLCNSAKISGNIERQNFCEHYYETGDITYLRGK